MEHNEGCTVPKNEMDTEVGLGVHFMQIQEKEISFENSAGG